MTRRSLLIALHWGVFLLLLAMIKGGSAAPVLRGAFVLAGAGWLLLLAMKGMQARPGPKLQGPLRTAFPALHWGMYALLALAVGTNALALTGLASLETAWTTLLVLLVASIFHAILHLWRHTTLYDGALRKMTPRALHRHL